jgi:preprotein translocase SecE subunit
MSRVTEITEEEENLSEEPVRRGSGDQGDGGGGPIKLPKLSLGGRISDFYQAVKQEMRKTTWPNRGEVWSTTVVVLLAIVFFGFYLWGVDQLVTLGFQALEKAIK